MTFSPNDTEFLDTGTHGSSQGNVPPATKGKSQTHSIHVLYTYLQLP